MLPGGKEEPLGIFSLDCGALIVTRPISSARESCASTALGISFSFTTQFYRVYEMLLSVQKYIGIQLIEKFSVLERVNTKGMNH